MTERSINPTKTPSAAARSDSDEPPTWWRRVWRRLIHAISPPADAHILREVVEELIDEPSSSSGLSSAERTLLGNIIHLRERKVADCMVPRADIIACDIQTSLKDLCAVMMDHNYSRIPIYRGTLDDVIGIVHVKDVLPWAMNPQPRDLADLLRPVIYVVPSMPASKLLVNMRQTRQHLAIVVDEFGGTDGVVTIEDLVELIVGEIEDEHDDQESPPIVPRADGSMTADARLSIDDFEQQTGLRLPDLDGQDVDTLGGYVTGLAGRMPRLGESFEHPSGLGFDVLDMDSSRIKRLRIRTPQESQPVPPLRAMGSA